MNLYLFNPSHDEALAAHTPYYYPTKIARHLTIEWGMLPGLWAEKGDCVWVDDAITEEIIQEKNGFWCENVRFVHTREMNATFWKQVDKVEPWGWDALVLRQLQKAGAPDCLLPSTHYLDEIRQLSSRKTTAEVLPGLVHFLNRSGIPSVGESHIVTSLDDAQSILNQWGDAMIKALWSCSGRGVFHVNTALSESEQGRMAKLLREQGAFEMQRFYKGTFDFALEFSVSRDGDIIYEGPSYFRTNPLGGYSGNVILPVDILENQIAEKIGGRLVVRKLIEGCKRMLSPVFSGQYTGMLGVDMMMVKIDDGTALFPCVEVNVRRTMGHVALNLIKRKLKAESLPLELRNLWYFCTNLC